MMTRNLYVVLGVSPRESSSGIRHAFRELAMRYHPDRAGAQATPYFQDIVEAYRVLSDPSTRASYDAGLRDAGDPVPVRRGPITVGGLEAEEAVPARVSLFRDFEVGRPSLEEVFERLLRGFTTPWAPKSQRVDPLDLELALTAGEAVRGGGVDLAVPVFYPCRPCHGAGYAGSFVCRFCSGRGMVAEDEPVRLIIPPRVSDGATFVVPLRGLGVHNLVLRVRVRVGP